MNLPSTYKEVEKFKEKVRIKTLLKSFDKNIKESAENNTYSKKLIKDKGVTGWGLYNKNENNELHRYYLYIDLENKNPEKILTVIMLNPSNTFPEKNKKPQGEFDKTVSNVIKIAQKSDIDGKDANFSAIEIFNLFSYIEADSQKVDKKNYFKESDEYYKINEVNKTFILKSLLLFQDPIMIAWGAKFNNSTNHQQVKQIIKFLQCRDVYTFCKNQRNDKLCKNLICNYPKHPGRINNFEKQCIEQCHKKKLELQKYSFANGVQ